MNTSVTCDAELVRTFRKVVLAYRGKIYGAMKNEIDEALKNHIKKLRKEIEAGGKNNGNF